jgi:hypothetical protein
MEVAVAWIMRFVFGIPSPVLVLLSGFGGLVVSLLASGTQDRGFAPGRRRRIFQAKDFLVCLPSEGK